MTTQLNHLTSQAHTAELMAQAERRRLAGAAHAGAGRSARLSGLSAHAPRGIARLAMRLRLAGGRPRTEGAPPGASGEPSLAIVHQTSDNCY